MKKRFEQDSRRQGRRSRAVVSYDYLVFNDQLDQAVEELKSIVIAERCRKSARLPKAQTLFNLGPH